MCMRACISPAQSRAPTYDRHRTAARAVRRRRARPGGAQPARGPTRGAQPPAVTPQASAGPQRPRLGLCLPQLPDDILVVRAAPPPPRVCEWAGEACARAHPTTPGAPPHPCALHLPPPHPSLCLMPSVFRYKLQHPGRVRRVPSIEVSHAAPRLAFSAHLRHWSQGEREPLGYRGNGQGREYDGGGLPLVPLGVRRICRSSWCKSGTSPRPLSRAPTGLAPSKFGKHPAP